MPAAAVGAVGVPVNAGDAKGAFRERLLVTVEAKLASSFIAAAHSFKVSRAPELSRLLHLLLLVRETLVRPTQEVQKQLK